MSVPVGELAVDLMVVDGHEPHARFHQPARQEHALAVLGAPVAVAEPGIFAVEVERVSNGFRAEQPERLLAIAVESAGARGRVGPAELAVDHAEERLRLL